MFFQCREQDRPRQQWYCVQGIYVDLFFWCKDAVSCKAAKFLLLRGCNYFTYRLFFLVGMKSLQRDCS